MKKEQAKRIAARKFAREISAQEVKQVSGAGLTSICVGPEENDQHQH